MLYEKNNNPCSYRMGDLFNKIYLYPYNKTSLSLKLDNNSQNIASAYGLDNEEGIILNVSSANYNSETSIENNKFLFKHTLQITLNEIFGKTFYDIIERLISKDWFIIFEDNNGNHFLMNYEFPQHTDYSYSFNDVAVGNTCTIQFYVNTNIPTISYTGTVNPKNVFDTVSCNYNIGKISSLRMVEKDKCSIITDDDDFEITVIQDALKNIEYMSDTLEYTEEYTNDTYTQTLSFSVPFEHYQYYFHYALLEFQKNRYYAFLETTNGNTLVIGNRFGLFPSYNITTSEEKTSANKINIKLTAMYTTAPMLISDGDVTVNRIVDVTYSPIFKRCDTTIHKYKWVLFRVVEDGVATNKYHALEGWSNEFIQEGYNVVATYNLYATGYGTPILSEDGCSGRRKESKICNTNGLPDAIYLTNIFPSSEFNVKSNCNISFTSDACVNTTYSNNKLVVTSNVTTGQCKIYVSIDDDEFEVEIPVYVTNEDNVITQKFRINCENQNVTVYLHELITNINTIQNDTPIELVKNITNDGYIFKVPWNALEYTVTYTINFTYNDGIQETIIIYQKACGDDSETIDDNTKFQWVNDGDNSDCLNSTASTNCTSAKTSTSADDYVCFNGDKYKMVFEYIDIYCNGNYKYIGYSKGDLIEEESEDCFTASDTASVSLLSVSDEEEIEVDYGFSDWEEAENNE